MKKIQYLYAILEEFEKEGIEGICASDVLGTPIPLVCTESMYMRDRLPEIVELLKRDGRKVRLARFREAPLD